MGGSSRRVWNTLSADGKAEVATAFENRLPEIPWPAHRNLPAETIWRYYDHDEGVDLTADERAMLDKLARVNSVEIRSAPSSLRPAIPQLQSPIRPRPRHAEADRSWSGSPSGARTHAPRSRSRVDGSGVLVLFLSIATVIGTAVTFYLAGVFR